MTHYFQIIFYSQFIENQTLGTVAKTIADIGDQGDDKDIKTIAFTGTVTRGFRPVSKDENNGLKSGCRECIIFSGASSLGDGMLTRCLRAIAVRVGLRGMVIVDDRAIRI